MNDERFAPVVAAWLKGSAAVPPDPRHSARAIMARLEPGTPVTRSASVAAEVEHASTRSVLAVMAVALIVVSFAGWLAVGMPPLAPGGDANQHVGAATSDDRAIHWRSSVVDLEAMA